MPRIVKWLLWAVAIAAAVVVLFLWVFPWVESLQQDPTLGLGSSDGALAGHDAPAAAPLPAQEVLFPR